MGLELWASVGLKDVSTLHIVVLVWLSHTLSESECEGLYESREAILAFSWGGSRGLGARYALQNRMYKAKAIYNTIQLRLVSQALFSLFLCLY